jgi:DNA-binding CsgD family transcriptional regulator
MRPVTETGTGRILGAVGLVCREGQGSVLMLALAKRAASEIERRRSEAAAVHGPRSDRRSRFGWESLTESERGIAELVASGLTNRQVGEQLFLSHHTVDFHLRSIFRKLGVKSRVGLARLVIECQVDPERSSMSPPRAGTASRHLSALV